MAAVLCVGGVALEMARGGWMGLGNLSATWDLGPLLLGEWGWERIGVDWFMGGVFGLFGG